MTELMTDRNLGGIDKLEVWKFCVKSILYGELFLRMKLISSLGTNIL